MSLFLIPTIIITATLISYWLIEWRGCGRSTQTHTRERG